MTLQALEMTDLGVRKRGVKKGRWGWGESREMRRNEENRG